MIVSVCPTFLCNNFCYFCYLGKLKTNKQILKLCALDKMLAELSSVYQIDGFNVFGGEVTLLENSYIVELIAILRKYCHDITITSNLAYMGKLEFLGTQFSTSYNAERQDFMKISGLMQNKPKCTFNLSTVILKSIIDKQPKEFFDNVPTNCKSITFQKYSPSVYNDVNINITESEYEDTLIKYIEYFLENKHKYDFSITNIYNIQQALKHKFDPTIRSNLFILPSCKYAILKYNNNMLEYFYEFDRLDEYASLLEDEKTKYYEKCCCCEFFGSCYAEHLNLNIDCSGHKNLLRHFKGKNNLLFF